MSFFSNFSILDQVKLNLDFLGTQISMKWAMPVLPSTMPSSWSYYQDLLRGWCKDRSFQHQARVQDRFSCQPSLRSRYTSGPNRLLVKEVPASKSKGATLKDSQPSCLPKFGKAYLMLPDGLIPSTITSDQVGRKPRSQSKPSLSLLNPDCTGKTPRMAPVG